MCTEEGSEVKWLSHRQKMNYISIHEWLAANYVIESV